MVHHFLLISFMHFNSFNFIHTIHFIIIYDHLKFTHFLFDAIQRGQINSYHLYSTTFILNLATLVKMSYLTPLYIYI